jgi:hypothetical protein
VTDNEVHGAAALYALDALAPEETMAVVAHVESCPPCRTSLAAYVETAGALALLAVPVVPNADLREQLLGALDGIPQTMPPAGHHRSRRPFRHRGSRRGRSRTLANEERFMAMFAPPIRSVVPLVPAKRRARMSAQIYVSADEATLGLVAAGLPDPGANIYQLWLVADGTPVPVDAFRPDANGQALVTIRRSPRHADAFAISLERSPNLPAPLGPIVLQSA